MGLARPLRIGLYSPYFGSVFGGGEKYLAVTAEAVREAFPAHRVEIIGAVPASRERYQDTLGVDLGGVELRATNRRVTGVHRWLNRLTPLRPLRDLVLGAQARRGTRAYDLYLPMIYRIAVGSQARRGILLCQFPYRGRTHLGDFESIICQSEYVRRWVARYWERDALVINPPVDVPATEPDWDAKERMVLSVGRFIATGHSKRHDLMVEVFRGLCDQGLQGWELHLAGSAHLEGPHAGYLGRLRSKAEGYPVHIHADLPYDDLQRLYGRASVYWHAAGYGADEEADPAGLEHFGMTTAEAMANGAVPIVIDRGGQPEVVTDGVDGFLWSSPAELASRTAEVIQDAGLRERLARAARKSCARFSREEFKRRMVAALGPTINELERG